MKEGLGQLCLRDLWTTSVYRCHDALAQLATKAYIYCFWELRCPHLLFASLGSLLLLILWAEQAYLQLARIYHGGAEVKQWLKRQLSQNLTAVSIAITAELLMFCVLKHLLQQDLPSFSIFEIRVVYHLILISCYPYWYRCPLGSLLSFCVK